MEADLQRLIIDDRERGIFRINRRAFLDDGILEKERRQVFDRSWLYAAHTSELKKEGDFITRTVGGAALAHDARCKRKHSRDVEYVHPSRKRDLPRRLGNARKFTCFYHAWTFDNRGNLIGVPDDGAYSSSFDRAERGLEQVRCAEYRGLIFVTFDKDIQSLDDYLAPVRPFLDLHFDYYESEPYVAPGVQQYSIDANWKLLLENSIDGYHGLSLHNRYYTQYLPSLEINTEGWSGPGASETSETSGASGAGRGLAFRNGHALVEGKVATTPLVARGEKELRERRERLVKKYGSERASLILDFNRNIFVYPNLMMAGNYRPRRTFYPVRADQVEVQAWALISEDESAAQQRIRLDSFVSFLGPAGFGAPDDASALEGCQRGFQSAVQGQWSDVSRGMKADQPTMYDEQQMRAFWRQWLSQVEHGVSAPLCADRAD